VLLSAPAVSVQTDPYSLFEHSLGHGRRRYSGACRAFLSVPLGTRAARSPSLTIAGSEGGDE